ncbi:MAG: transcription antitermination factor NusB [Fimbriimonadaceae bacterium]|nr:transcription antitermination factor NusB [Fimbriimonadaceae bacterium]
MTEARPTPVSRRAARVIAMCVLYEVDLVKHDVYEVLNERIASWLPPVSTELELYAERLVHGYLGERDTIDRLIKANLKNYTLDRLLPVDRAILRMAAFELRSVPGIPPAVTIDEAVEIARRYSTRESYAFINGVLAAILRTTEKANWNPANAPEVEAPVAVVAEGFDLEDTESGTEDSATEELAEVTLDAESDEGKRVRRFGWVLRSETVPEVPGE